MDAHLATGIMMTQALGANLQEQAGTNSVMTQGRSDKATRPSTTHLQSSRDTTISTTAPAPEAVASSEPTERRTIFTHGTLFCWKERIMCAANQLAAHTCVHTRVLHNIWTQHTHCWQLLLRSCITSLMHTFTKGCCCKGAKQITPGDCPPCDNIARSVMCDTLSLPVGVMFRW